jgi:expansin (peptidoglycan-binding protein)
MKVISNLLIPMALAAATFVAADFDRNLWEEVPAAMYNHGTTSMRRNLADEVAEANAIDKRAKWMYNNHVASWYSGHDLQNPACYPGKVPHIRDDMKIAAIKDHKKCFLCIHVSITKAHPRRSDLILRSTTKTTTAKIIDFCAGCDQKGEKVNDSHIDLSKGAFKDLGSLNDGELPIAWKTTKCFKSKNWPLTPGKKY